MLPTTVVEERLWKKDLMVAGIDEAGRGCLAGPVVAAAVIFRPAPWSNFHHSTGLSVTLEGVNDSKKLSPKKREKCFGVIQRHAKAIGIGLCSAEEIDAINILQASLLAMKRAVEGLNIMPDYLLIDGPYSIDIQIPQACIKGGDGKILSIASASIIAKVMRDQLMQDYHLLFPMYGFEKNKGYPTKSHKQALLKFGPCYLHRLSFKLGDFRLNI
jgi:ribonuclease HII